jgi:hypothetical protein
MSAQEPNLLAEVDDANCPHGVDLGMADFCDRCDRSVTHTTREYIVRYPSTAEVDEFGDIADALNWLRGPGASTGVLFERTVTTTVEHGEWRLLEHRPVEVRPL